MWKQVHLLDLAQLAVQGGLGHYGAIGGPDFFPNILFPSTSLPFPFVYSDLFVTIQSEQVDQDASHKVTCAIRQRYTKQRITGCPWRGREQEHFECEKAYDGKFDENSQGWAFGGSLFDRAIS